MNRRSAFATLGATGIHRQWHMTASDGVEVVSLWDHMIDGDQAESHVHAKHFDNFQIGQEVRAVIQEGIREPETGNMKTVNSEPSKSAWKVVSKTVRPLEGKWISKLHVLGLHRVSGARE